MKTKKPNVYSPLLINVNRPGTKKTVKYYVSNTYLYSGLFLAYILYLPILISGFTGIASGANLASLISPKDRDNLDKFITYGIGVPSATVFTLFNVFAQGEYIKFFRKNRILGTITYILASLPSIPGVLFTVNGLPGNYGTFGKWFFALMNGLGSIPGNALGINNLIKRIKDFCSNKNYNVSSSGSKPCIEVAILGLAFFLAVITMAGPTSLSAQGFEDNILNKIFKGKNALPSWLNNALKFGLATVFNTFTILTLTTEVGKKIRNVSINSFIPESIYNSKTGFNKKTGFFEWLLPRIVCVFPQWAAIGNAVSSLKYTHSEICEIDGPVWEESCNADIAGIIMTFLPILVWAMLWMEPSMENARKLGKGMDNLLKKCCPASICFSGNGNSVKFEEIKEGNGGV